MRPGLLRPRKGGTPRPCTRLLAFGPGIARGGRHTLLAFGCAPGCAPPCHRARPVGWRRGGKSAIPHRHGPRQGQSERPASFPWGRAALTCARRCYGDPPSFPGRVTGGALAASMWPLPPGPCMIVGRGPSGVFKVRALAGPARLCCYFCTILLAGRALTGRMARAQAGGRGYPRNGWTERIIGPIWGARPPSPPTNAGRVLTWVRLRPASVYVVFPTAFGSLGSSLSDSA